MDYTFSILNDFPNQLLDASVLSAQINAALGVGPPTLQGININGDVVVITFDVALTAPQETTLNGLVAAHTGAGFVTGAQTLMSEAEQTNTTTTFAQAASLSSGILAGGTYIITWYCEISVLAADTTSGAIAQVTWNGTERAADANAMTFYTSFSGSVTLTVTPLEAPVLAINFRRVGTANTARIRRLRASIIRVLEE